MMFVARHHLNAVGIGDYMEIGEHVAGLIENEARTLPFLRHLAVKEIKGHRFRSDIHDRRQRLLIDRDVVLLF